MILLIGMKMSFTKKPMKPMIAKPMEVACAIFENSASREAGEKSQEMRVEFVARAALAAVASAYQYGRAWCSASPGATSRGKTARRRAGRQRAQQLRHL